MKKWFFIVIFFFVVLPATARHVAGGELFYEYLGDGPVAGTSTYRITLRLFRDCFSTGPLLENEPVIVGFYANNIRVTQLSLPRIDAVRSISLNTKAFPCLVGTVNVCYEIGIYSATITLVDNSVGYTLSRLGCCRVDRISNLSQPLNVGSNYVTTIPGSNLLPAGHNNSPQFFVRDTALVCAKKSFKLDFGAADMDNDALTYSLCDAYTSGSGTQNVTPPANLNLVSLPYIAPYSGNFPLGAKVKINPVTGIISGIAPGEGSYVVNVCITEWRNGKAFAEHRKDFILKVQNCDFIEASLPDKIIQCNDFVVHFENQSTSSAITSYLWDFGNPSASNNSSTSPTFDYTYPDTGRYMVRLFVTGPKDCAGEDSTEVFVYPGFKAGFTVTGSCYLNPFQFKDATVSKYGVVNSWRWDFGVDTTNGDTSILQNPKYLYPAAATRNVGLVVTNTKGCIDTLYKDLLVSNKPLLQLPFKDTLICSIDTLAIPVGNTGSFSWLPNKNIIGANTARPLVFPKDTTRYVVTVNDNGCVNTDTVTVNVLSFIKVNAGKDSVLCATDIVRLNPVSNALSYQWTSSSGEKPANVKYPFVKPLVNTQYYVKANLGKCEDKDTIMLKAVSYPVSIAGADTIICFGTRIQLQGIAVGSSVTWLPAGSLINAHTPRPIAGPSRTTTYILNVSDTLGCPKTVSDTILITVVPRVVANAGNDTTVLPNQPLQLTASGGTIYRWSPEIGLNDPSIFNPVAVLNADIDSVIYKVRITNSGGCYAEDEILVRVYNKAPDILVPSAFTPNGDGRNDILRPVTLGITTLRYFRVYSRWGQLLFSTNEPGKGWDGTYNGNGQPSGTYVFSTEGSDYLGKTVFRKGTSVLIR